MSPWLAIIVCKQEVKPNDQKIMGSRFDAVRLDTDTNTDNKWCHQGLPDFHYENWRLSPDMIN